MKSSSLGELESSSTDFSTSIYLSMRRIPLLDRCVRLVLLRFQVDLQSTLQSIQPLDSSVQPCHILTSFPVSVHRLSPHNLKLLAGSPPLEFKLPCLEAL